MAFYDTVYVPPLTLVDVTLKCRGCGQTTKAMMDMPSNVYPEGSEIVLNVVACPFDTEEGITNLMRGVSLHYEREARNQRP